jgi:hypothetical protein
MPVINAAAIAPSGPPIVVWIRSVGSLDAPEKKADRAYAGKITLECKIVAVRANGPRWRDQSHKAFDAVTGF